MDIIFSLFFFIYIQQNNMKFDVHIEDYYIFIRQSFDLISFDFSMHTRLFPRNELLMCINTMV